MALGSGNGFARGGQMYKDFPVGNQIVTPSNAQVAALMQRFIPSGSQTSLASAPSQIYTPPATDASPYPQRKPTPPGNSVDVGDSEPDGMPASSYAQPHPTPQRKPLPPGVTIDVGSSEPDFKRGGKAKKKFAEGGIPTSEALSPWYARAEERSMVHPEGLINSTGAGRTDVHNISVPSGSYIIPADVVSGLSEGNTLGGASVMDRMMHSNPYGIEGGGSRHGGMGIPRPPAPYRETNPGFSTLENRGGKTGNKQDGNVPIVVAGGEFLIHPQTIIKKFGSLKKGHAALDAFVRKTREKTVKTMAKLPGPKK